VISEQLLIEGEDPEFLNDDDPGLLLNRKERKARLSWGFLPILYSIH
jgi:hypothetical protein